MVQMSRHRHVNENLMTHFPKQISDHVLRIKSMNIVIVTS